MKLFVNHRRSIGRFAAVIIFLLTPVLTSLAQTDQWLRVFTEEESLIDVDRSSLVLEQDQKIRAQFRTTLLRPEPVPGKSGVEYHARVDSIQFSIKDRRYRIAETKLLDTSGKVVLSYSSTAAADWKPLWGRTGNRLFSAARQLQPFGVWRVASYRYSSGEPASDNDPPELRSLLGSDIRFNLDQVAAGKETCSAPIFDTKIVTNKEFVKIVGSPLKSLGILSDKVDAIVVNCETKNDVPSKTILLRLPDNKIMMLWEGVFVELERTKNLFLP